MKIQVNDMLRNMCGIYKLDYPNGKCYVGQSKDIKRRMWEHNNIKRLDNHFNSPCDLAIKKYGIFKEIEILEFCPAEQLDEKEQYWINFYHSNEKDKGYNLTIGGQNGRKSIDYSQAIFTEEEVLDIRKRRFNQERKIDVYQDYKDKKFNTFEKVWLGISYNDIGTEYIIPTGLISRQQYSSIANSGERNYGAKLTEKDVKEIRKRYDAGEPAIKIWPDYSFITKDSLRRVCRRETWKGVEP